MVEYVITGFHGTNIANTQKILDNNFNPSEGDKEWLGTGTYFFTEGYPDLHPQNAAARWAEASSWDNRFKRNNYIRCSVLKAKIKVGELHFLDLTTSDGMEVFNYHRLKFMEIIKSTKLNFKQNKTPIFRDGELINEMRQAIKISVIKGHFYIKFKEERIFQVDFRLPNCTIIAVFDPHENIEKKEIQVIQKFSI